MEGAVARAPAPVSEAGREATRTQIRGSSLLLAGRLLSVGVNFAVQILIVRYLTKSDYGAFAYALSLVALGESVAALGLDRALSRFLPIYDEEGRRARILGTLVLAAGTVLALGLGVILAVVGLRGLLAGSIGGEHASTVLLILILLAPVQALDGLLMGTFAVFTNARAIFFRKYVLAPGLRLAVVLLLVLTGSGVAFLAAGYVLAGALAVAIYLAVLVRTLRRQGVFEGMRARGLELPARELFGFALPLLAVDLLHVVTNTTNVLMLGFFGNGDDVADYRVVLPVAHLNMLVMSSFTLLFTPVAARLYARGDRAGIDDLYWKTAVWLTVATFPIFAFSFALAEPVTVALFGERYRDSAPILALLAVGYYFGAALGFNGLTLRVYGFVRYIVVVSVAAAAVNVVLNLTMIPAWGPLGAGIATCLTLVLHNVLKQAGLRRGTAIRVFASGEAGVYLTVAVAAAVLAITQHALEPPLILAAALATAVSAAVLVSTRAALRVGETFPELARVPVLRRLVG